MDTWVSVLIGYVVWWIVFLIHLPIFCIISRWIFRVNEVIDHQKRILKKIDVLTDTVNENDPMLQRKNLD